MTEFQFLLRQNYKFPSASCAWYTEICSLSIRTSRLQLNSKTVACYLMKEKLCPSLTEFQVTKQLTKTAPISGGLGNSTGALLLWIPLDTGWDVSTWNSDCCSQSWSWLRCLLSGIKRMKMSSVLGTLRSSVRNGCSVSKNSNSARMFSTQTLLGFLLNNPVKNEIFYWLV